MCVRDSCACRGSSTAHTAWPPWCARTIRCARARAGRDIEVRRIGESSAAASLLSPDASQHRLAPRACISDGLAAHILQPARKTGRCCGRL
eukprot:357995-Chlamydomonas_euryale.AAC.5